MFNIRHDYTERNIKYLNLDHKDIFDEDYKKTTTWFGIFTSIIMFKVRNKIKDIGSDKKSEFPIIEGFKK